MPRETRQKLDKSNKKGQNSDLAKGEELVDPGNSKQTRKSKAMGKRGQCSETGVKKLKLSQTELKDKEEDEMTDSDDDIEMSQNSPGEEKEENSQRSTQVRIFENDETVEMEVGNDEFLSEDESMIEQSGSVGHKKQAKIWKRKPRELLRKMLDWGHHTVIH